MFPLFLQHASSIWQISFAPFVMPAQAITVAFGLHSYGCYTPSHRHIIENAKFDNMYPSFQRNIPAPSTIPRVRSMQHFCGGLDPLGGALLSIYACSFSHHAGSPHLEILCTTFHRDQNHIFVRGGKNVQIICLFFCVCVGIFYLP